MPRPSADETKKQEQKTKPKEKVKIRVFDIFNPQLKYVDVGLNGVIYRIQAGEVVEVPIALYEILQNAVEVRVDPQGNKIRLKRFNVEVVDLGREVIDTTAKNIDKI